MKDLQQLTQKSADLTEYFKSANQGDEGALAVLRKELSGPRATELIESVGNLARHVETATLMRFGDQSGAKAVVLEKLSRLRAELGWATSNPTERLLIERVAQTWLQLHMLELYNAQTNGRTLKQETHDEERITRAERRHLSAITVLARVRRLALPIRIDVNLS